MISGCLLLQSLKGHSIFYYQICFLAKISIFFSYPNSCGLPVIISSTEAKLMLPVLPPPPFFFTWSFHVKSGAMFSRTRRTVRVIGWIVASIMMAGIWWTHCFTFNPIFTWCSIWPAKKTLGVTNLHFQEKQYNSDFQIGF